MFSITNTQGSFISAAIALSYGFAVQFLSREPKEIDLRAWRRKFILVEGLQGCVWKSSATEQNQIGLTPLPQNTGGISDIYDNKPHSVYFEPVDINGYPGVYTDIQDARADGSCTLWVGVTDQLAVSVIPKSESARTRATRAPSRRSSQSRW